jgi:2-polyprenyl-3-methyl-5-hydroxy-6-metoxy-1,4-benzoquinol methylase
VIDHRTPPARGPGPSEAPSCEICGTTVDPWPIAPGCWLWRCPSCDHVMRDLDLCWANAREHAWGGDAGFDRIRTKLTMRSLLSVIPNRDPLDVLEIGFGQGLLLSAFLERGHRVSGIDPGMLERGVGESLRTRATLYAAPAEGVDLPAGSFDMVFGVHVIEHLKDPAAVFASCERALRPGGLAYFMTPNAGSRGLELFRDAWWNLEDPTHVRFFSRRSISLALRAAGFERVLTRIPRWDSMSLEISSLLRRLRRESGPHGVLSSKATMPLYAGLLPVAIAARALWPALSPSMEVLGLKRATQ